MEKANGIMKVLISNDGMEAFLGSEGETPDTAPSTETLRALLAEHGVVFGVQEDALDSLSKGPAAAGKVMVAQGKMPVAGKDGWVEHCFEKKLDVPTDAKEKMVDYHNLGWIHNVSKSATVAIVHPSEPGVPGMSVRGQPILPKARKGPEAKLGRGVMYDKNDPHKIIASVDGNATIDANGVLHVQPCLTIQGNVDYSTGDIDFIGSVIITGDVKGSFSVKAGQSIEVRGSVEDSTLEAGGEVKIWNGFTGQGKGSISAGGNVKVQHVLNQTITSGAQIFIDREAVCATLRAEDKIVAPKAVFVGCTLEAGREIEVFDLGNGDQTQAKVRVGKRGMLLELITQAEKNSQEIQKQIEEVKNAIYVLVRAQLDSGVLTPGQQELQKKLRSAQTELVKTAEAIQKDKEQLAVRLKENGAARIVVHDTIFADVFVELNGMKKMIPGAIKEIVLSGSGGPIEEKPLE